jgi:hypothetical protein
MQRHKTEKNLLNRDFERTKLLLNKIQLTKNRKEEL